MRQLQEFCRSCEPQLRGRAQTLWHQRSVPGMPVRETCTRAFGTAGTTLFTTRSSPSTTVSPLEAWCCLTILAGGANGLLPICMPKRSLCMLHAQSTCACGQVALRRATNSSPHPPVARLGKSDREGARRAFYDFFASRGEHPLLERNDYTQVGKGEAGWGLLHQACPVTLWRRPMLALRMCLYTCGLSCGSSPLRRLASQSCAPPLPWTTPTCRRGLSRVASTRAPSTGPAR